MSIRDESLYTNIVMDPQRGTTKITERVPSPQNITTKPSSLRDFEANQAAIDLTRSLVKRFIADIWNRGEVDLIPEVCSSSLRFNGNTGFDRVGHEGLARMVNTIREALDDYHCEIHSMVVENNKAFCRLRFTGRLLALERRSNDRNLSWIQPNHTRTSSSENREAHWKFAGLPADKESCGMDGCNGIHLSEWENPQSVGIGGYQNLGGTANLRGGNG